MTVEQRIAEIQARYAPGDTVSRALATSAPQLANAVARVAKALGGSTKEGR